MRSWTVALLLLSAAACSSDHTGPGDLPDTPESLASTTLDGAVALTWTDNAYAADPANFQYYRIYSTGYNIDSGECDTSWQLEGTTVAPEFLVGALSNGVSRCFSVTAVGSAGAESARSDVRSDTPRPDARNIVLWARQEQNANSGFRFWKDGNGDRLVQDNELGLTLDGTDPSIDFSVERDGNGRFFLAPVRQGTGVEPYSAAPVEDLTSIDVAPCLPSSDPASCSRYETSAIEARPGYAYVFEMESGDPTDPYLRYGALRLTHVGTNFLIMDWAYQTDPGNPELLVRGLRPATH